LVSNTRLSSSSMTPVIMFLTQPPSVPGDHV